MSGRKKLQPVANGNLETAVLDSSIWVAYFLGKDKFHQFAEAIVEGLLKFEYILIIPEFVYYEVLAVTARTFNNAVETTSIIQFFENNFHCNIIFFEKKHMQKLIKKYILIHKLKTLDLLILLSCIDLRPNKFYTFDDELRREYNKYLNSTHD